MAQSAILKSARVAGHLSAYGMVALALIGGATPSSSLQMTAERDVTLQDLVEASTIDSISPSPDHKQVAFRILTPSIASNSIKARWFRMRLDIAGSPVQLGGTTEPRLLPFFDAPLDERPAWTADGKSILVLAQGSEGVQVHLLGQGGVDRRLTADAADIESFVITANGAALDYVHRNSRASIAAAEDNDLRDGIHFDRTIAPEGMPLTGNFLAGQERISLRRWDDKAYRSGYAGQLQHSVSTLPADAHAADGSTSFQSIDTSTADFAKVRLARGGRSIGLARLPDDPDRLQARYQVTFFNGSAATPCVDPVCIGNSTELRLITLGADGTVYILREAQGSGRSGLFAMSDAKGVARRVISPGSSLDGGNGRSCALAADELICNHAGPSSPQKLVAVELRTGGVRTLMDPNSWLRKRLYPRTKFIEWQDRYGRRMTGVLVYPVRATRPTPLVITTYRCRGLLRGGVAQVAPEFMLAQRGFTVICVNSNPENNDLPPESSTDPVLKMHKADVEGYRAIITKLAEKGLIDRTRVGIAGHSYTANVIAYAISHTDLFRAVVFGSGISIDSASYWVTAPTADGWRRKDVLDLVHLPHPRVRTR